MTEIRMLDGRLNSLEILFNTHQIQTRILHAAYSEEANGPDTCRVVYAPAPGNAPRTATPVYVRIIDAGDTRTYMVRNPDISRSPSGTTVTLDGERIWIWLSTRHLIPEHMSFTDTSISSILEKILSASGASAEFSATISQNANVDFFSIPIYTTALNAIRNLAAKTGRVMRFSEDPAGAKRLVFDAASYTTTALHSLRFGANVSGINRDMDLAERVTRVYAVGGGDPPLTLQDSSMSSRPYIDAASYSTENHYVGVYKNSSLLNWENLVTEDKNPDFSGAYTDGVANGWFKIGEPTCTKNTKPKYVEHGTASQKIVTSGTSKQGIECPITGAQNTPCVRWTHLYVASMDARTALHVELAGGGKTTYNVILGSDYGATNRFVTITRLNATLPSASQVLKIYTEGGGATFYVDAVLVARGLDFAGFVVGSMADQLHAEAIAYLREREHAGIQYSISSPTVIPALYDRVQVEDDEVGTASLRVEKITKNLLYPRRSRYSVGKSIRTPNENAISETKENAAQISDSDYRHSRAAKESAVQSLAERREVVFFSGRPWKKKPSDRASIRGGNIHVGGEDRYSVTDWTGAAVGYQKTVYVYIDEATGSIAQTLDPAIVADHPGLYKVETPASTSTGFPTYTQLFFSAATPSLDAPYLSLTATRTTIKSRWSPVADANGYRLEWKAASASAWSRRNFTSAPPSFTLTNLTANTLYTVRVKATSTAAGVQESPWSTRTATTSQPIPIPRPTSFLTIGRAETDSVNVVVTVADVSFSNLRLYITLYQRYDRPPDPLPWRVLVSEAEMTAASRRRFTHSFDTDVQSDDDPHAIGVRATADNYIETTWYVWTPST